MEKNNKLLLIHKDVGTEQEIIEWLEFMDYSKSIIIGDIRVTKWVETYEVGTREGKQENSLSTEDVKEVAKRVIRENKLLANSKQRLEELEEAELDEMYMPSALSDLFGYTPTNP